MGASAGAETAIDTLRFVQSRMLYRRVRARCGRYVTRYGMFTSVTMSVIGARPRSSRKQFEAQRRLAVLP
jgi:hypothetical protein